MLSDISPILDALSPVSPSCSMTRLTPPCPTFHLCIERRLAFIYYLPRVRGGQSKEQEQVNQMQASLGGNWHCTSRCNLSKQTHAHVPKSCWRRIQTDSMERLFRLPSSPHLPRRKPHWLYWNLLPSRHTQALALGFVLFFISAHARASQGMTTQE